MWLPIGLWEVTELSIDKVGCINTCFMDHIQHLNFAKRHLLIVGQCINIFSSNWEQFWYLLWVRGLVAGLSWQRPVFVEFRLHRTIFLYVFWFSTLSIIPPMPHIHISFIYNKCLQLTYHWICCLLLLLLQYTGYVLFTCPNYCNWYDN
jgi:hypothetical protein